MVKTESEIKLDPKAECPARSVAELRKLCKHLLNRGHGDALARETACEGEAGIPSGLYTAFLEWMWDPAEVVRAGVFTMTRGLLANDTGPRILKYDARWHTPGYSSTHGSGNCVAFRMPQPLPERTGDKAVDDAAVAAVVAENILRGGMIPMHTHHLSQNAKASEIEIGVQMHDGSAGAMDPDGGEQAIRILHGLGCKIDGWVQDGDGKTESRAKDVATQLGFELNVAGCCNHVVKCAINQIIKTATKDVASRSVCSQRCKNRKKANGELGKRKACRRITIRFARAVLSKAIMTWLKRQPIPQNQQDILAIQARFEVELETKILAHGFGNCSPSLCEHAADWDATKPGRVVTCWGQQGLIKKVMLEKIGKLIPRLYIPGHGLYDTNVVESMNHLSILWMPKSRHPTALEYQLAMKFVDCHAAERHLWDNMPESTLTWKEQLYEQIAELVNVHVDMILPASERKAIRAQVQEAARRSRYNRSEKGLIARAKSKVKSKRLKEERNKDSALQYPGNGGGLETSGGGGGGGAAATRKGKVPCTCGCPCGKVHYRSSHSDCGRKKPKVVDDVMIVDEASADQVAEAEAEVDVPDLSIEERLERAMEEQNAADSVRGISLEEELGTLTDEEGECDADYDETAMAL
jgi:hypothetical protein